MKESPVLAKSRITWLMILVYASVIALGMTALAVFVIWIAAKVVGQ